MARSSWRTVIFLSCVLFLGCLQGESSLPKEAELPVNVQRGIGSEGEALRLGTYVRTRIALPLLARPDGQSTVLWTIPADSKVAVLEGPEPGGWYEVSAGGGRWGYVPGDALVPGVAQRLFRLPTTDKIVSLTFNVAPDAGLTAYILDSLALLGVKASFSVTAAWANAHPELLLRMVKEGHGILNGGSASESFTGEATAQSPLTYAQRATELWRTHAAVLRISGAETKPFFRPPHGDWDESVLRDVSSRGYDYACLWSLDSRTWWSLPLHSRVEQAVAETTPGTVFLFQLSRESQDALIVPRIVAKLRDQGYRFALITDFVGEGGHPQTRELGQQLSYWQGGVVRGPRDEKKISLVFTGGYHAEGAVEILDTLAARRLRASFFLTGDFLRLYPELTKRIVREGHYLGAHSDQHLLYASWDDVNETLVTHDEFTADLDQNLADLASFGVPLTSMRFWIPPYEWFNQEISDWSRARDMVLVKFTEGANTEYDWVPESAASYIPSRKILDGLLTFESTRWQGLNGFIMLIHLGSGPDRQDKFAPYVPELVDTLQARGYGFEGIDDLLRDAVLPGPAW